MSRRTFRHRSETFGYESERPWAHEAFRLLFAVPRLYRPLADAWEGRYPGTVRTLGRLVDMGFVTHQPPVIVDTRSAELADKPGRKVPRYRTTSRGMRLHQQVREDIRVLEDTFSNLTPGNVKGVARLLTALDLDGSHARFGLSAAHAVALSGLPERTGRWWVSRLVETGHVRQLPFQLADVREVVPEHWRPTRMLCRQLADVLDEFHPAAAPLKVQFRLGRTRFLDDVDPARIGISGATDFDHDIEAQQVLAALLRSPRCAAGGVLTVEPRIVLPLDDSSYPYVFREDADGTLFYQPDAEMRETRDGKVWRSIIEYERFQSRRDAWNHIERFLGYLHTRTLPFEGAVLRFVLDSEARERSYVALIEAFATHAIENPEQLPANPVILMVSSSDRLVAAADALDDLNWFRIPLPTAPSGESNPVLHDKDDSPFDEFFARRTTT